MRRPLPLLARAAVVPAAAVLLVACSGSDEDASPPATSSSAAEEPAPSPSPEPSEEPEAPQAGSQFCTEAEAIPDSLGDSFTDANDPDALNQGLQDAADEIRSIEPPDEIAGDWTTLADGLEQAATSLEGLDVTDPEAAAQLQAELGELQTQLETSGANVETYLREQCGIDTEGTAAPSS